MNLSKELHEVEHQLVKVKMDLYKAIQAAQKELARIGNDELWLTAINVDFAVHQTAGKIDNTVLLGVSITAKTSHCTFELL